MKLVTINNERGHLAGLLVNEHVVSIHEAAMVYDFPEMLNLPTDVLGVIDAGPSLWKLLRQLATKIKSEPSKNLRLYSEDELLAPIPRPRKNIVCVGRNYADHALEQGASAPSVPVFFTKPPTTVAASNSTIPFPPGTSELDYEGELGVVIGIGGKNIPRNQAMQHVFGYIVLNDITARDIQRRHLQWYKGKSFDFSCPMSSAIVSADEVSNVKQLRVQTFVNGEKRQDAPVADMIFDIPTIIAELSSGMTLEPGDIIATGTPSGVGAPTRRFLAPGDVVEVIIDGIGRVSNRIGEADTLDWGLGA